jgi:hypothetical protein
MLEWTHSGFSADYANWNHSAPRRTAEVLAKYIARPPVSLSKMLVEEHENSVLYRSKYNPYFRTNARLFPAIEFLVQLLQHLPDVRAHLVRRYGLYSSRSRDVDRKALAGAPGPRGMEAAALAAAASPPCRRSPRGLP